MKLGAKVTVIFPVPRTLQGHSQPIKFLRCYVIRRLAAGWQLYDPVRNWSWGLNEREAGARVVCG